MNMLRPRGVILKKAYCSEGDKREQKATLSLLNVIGG